MPVVASFAIEVPVDAVEKDGIRSFLLLSLLVRKVLMHVFLKGFTFIQYQQFYYRLLISSIALCSINVYTEYTEY